MNIKHIFLLTAFALFGLKASADITNSSGNTALVSTGPTFTLGTGTGGCTAKSNLLGGSWSGHFTCTGTAGASTIVINLPPQNGSAWECHGSDVTSGVVWAQAAPLATNSCKLTGTLTTTGDVITWGATGH